jgi:hypothetical protein
LGTESQNELSYAEICRVPNMMEVLEDGTIKPTNYDLREEDAGTFSSAKT